MEASLPPTEVACNSAVETLRIDGLGASQKNALEHDLQLGSRILLSALLAMELFKFLWDFCDVCLNAPEMLLSIASRRAAVFAAGPRAWCVVVAGAAEAAPARRDGLTRFATRLVFVLWNNVEDRAVGVHARTWRRGVPVRHEAFRRDDTLDDPSVRSGPMAADAEDTVASIRVVDSKDGVPVGGVWADEVVVNEELEVIEFPTGESGNPVRAASGWYASARAATKCHPGPAAGHIVGFARLKRARTGELDLQTGRVPGRCECRAPFTKGGRACECQVGDVPADGDRVVGPRRDPHPKEEEYPSDSKIPAPVDFHGTFLRSSELFETSWAASTGPGATAEKITTIAKRLHPFQRS